MIKIEFNTKKILDYAKMEMSREASQLHNEQGESLYNTLRPVSRDDFKMNALLDQAVRELMTTVERLSPEREDDSLYMNIPSCREGNIALIIEEIELFLALYICLEIFREKYPPSAETYQTMVVQSLQRIRRLLFSVKRPTR